VPDAQVTAPNPFGRVLLALIVGQMGLHATMAGVRMAAPLQALREGHSAWSVGVLLALYAAAPVLLSMHAGRMADRLGYHLSLIHI
jgi:MFS family permease